MTQTILQLVVVFFAAFTGSILAGKLTKPAFVTTRKPEKGVEEITINLFSDPDWDVHSCINKALEKKPKMLKVTIVGLGRMCCDPVLAVYHLLLNRGDTRLAVNVQTSLVGGSLLFVLLADEVEIRPDTWFEIEKIEEDPEIKGMRDLESVDKLLNQYLPSKLLKGKRVPLMETLEAYECLKGSDLDQQLQKLFVA
jgi:hypothetical protein